MNIFQEAKQVLDKDGKVNALGPHGKTKLTGREVSTYFRRNKVKDKQIKKAVEVALDMGGAMTVAYKEISKFYGKKVADSKEVTTALQYANEETWKEGDELLEKDIGKGKYAKFQKHSTRMDWLDKYGTFDLDPKKPKEKDSAKALWNLMDKLFKKPKDKNLQKQVHLLRKKEKLKPVIFEQDGDLGKASALDGDQSADKGLTEDMIQDFEIRFGKESDWRKAEKIVMAYLKKDVPKHAKALLTKTSVIGPDPMMVAVGDTKQKLKPPVNLNKLYDTLRKLPSSRDKYWISIPKKQEKDALGEEKYPQSLLLKNKGEYDPKKMSSMQKKKFDALYKKMDGGKEHQAIKKKIKNQVKADDAFHYMIQKKVMGEEVTEAFSKTPKSGAEVAKMMMKSKTMKGFAAKVKKMKTVTAVQLDKMLPDYVSGGDIGAMFEEITEGKLGDSIIRKDFPNVWAASAKDRTILKKFHAKVDTSNYKKQKQIYNKNKKAFMSGLNNEKLSSIMKKMTVKKGPMKGWMTDEVIRILDRGKLNVQEASLEEINLNMPEKVRVQLLTLYNKAMDVPYGSPAFKGIKKQIDKINDKYAVKNESEVTRAKEIADLKDKHKREIEKEKEDIKDIQKDEQLVGKKAVPFFDTYRSMKDEGNYSSVRAKPKPIDTRKTKFVDTVKGKSRRDKTIGEEEVIPFFDTFRNMQEEVMDITVDPKNKLPKTDQQHKIAQNIYNLAKTYNCKVAMVGKHLRFKGTKGDMNAIGRAVIGKSSMGNATGTDMSTPQIDKMLNKNLK